MENIFQCEIEHSVVVEWGKIHRGAHKRCYILMNSDIRQWEEPGDQTSCLHVGVKSLVAAASREDCAGAGGRQGAAGGSRGLWIDY